VDKRWGYLVIAVSLTVSDGFVAAYYGRPVWRAWSGDTWSSGLLFMMVAMEATSMANQWAQAMPRSAKLQGGRDV
jgi:hypothetical protein